MTGFLIAIRNFIFALVLSWVGISFTAPKDDPLPPRDAPEKTQPVSPDSLLKRG